MLPPSGSRIVVAMSGGVDSSVAAALLKEQGYDCVGVTLRLVPEPESKPVFEPCCGLEAAHDAGRVCAGLGIPHEVLFLVDRFEQEIISGFVETYRQARTPNPCMLCNRRIKFGALYERADALGAQYIAMGHFARLERRGERIALRRGAYRDKDQSYVLAALRQEQLARAVFPLGHLSKAEVRELARERGLITAQRSESQEICFVPDNDYAAFITGRSRAPRPGPILSVTGEVLGRHQGLIHYTVGQRRGLGIAAPRPLYVVRLDAERNALIVGFEEDTFAGRFTTGPVVWGGLAPQTAAFTCEVQLRSRHTAAAATVTPSGEGTVVELAIPQRSVTPGQWAVFYEGETVWGAAMIETFTPLSREEAGSQG